MVQLKDNEVRTIFELKDFIELVDEYMGFDCKKYVEENLHEESEVEGLEDKIYELEDKIYELEEQLEEVRKAVNHE